MHVWLEQQNEEIYLCIPCVYQLAKAEKLKPLEVELRRLEDLSKSIVDDFAYMRAREEEMRDTNGKNWCAWGQNRAALYIIQLF